MATFKQLPEHMHNMCILYKLIMNLIFKTIAYDGDGNVSSITKDYA